MTIELVEEFFSDADFATPATYTKGSTSKSISVIFDRENTLTTLGDVPVQMTAPKALCKADDITGVDRTATLTISSVVYKIAEIHPEDAGGIVELILTRDS